MSTTTSNEIEHEQEGEDKMTNKMTDQTEDNAEEILQSPEEFLAHLGRRLLERVTWHTEEQIDANVLDLDRRAEYMRLAEEFIDRRPSVRDLLLEARKAALWDAREGAEFGIPRLMDRAAAMQYGIDALLEQGR